MARDIYQLKKSNVILRTLNIAIILWILTWLFSDSMILMIIVNLIILLPMAKNKYDQTVTKIEKFSRMIENMLAKLPFV
jgi:hypothetical protein